MGKAVAIVAKEARIEDMAVDYSAKLTSDQRTKFIKLLETEMDNKRSLYQVQANKQDEDAIEQYRKQTGYYSLRTKLDAAKMHAGHLEEQINALGLSIDGTRYQYGYSQSHDPKLLAAVKKLDGILEAVRKNRPDASLESKIIARLLVATTVGEALVILKQVMGNGLLPSVPLTAITRQV